MKNLKLTKLLVMLLVISLLLVCVGCSKTDDTKKDDAATNGADKKDDYSDITQSAISMNELQMLIFEAVSRMPEKRREVFRMSRYQNVENKEIARRLNIDVRTVDNHITNALSDIREYIIEAYA